MIKFMPQLKYAISNYSISVICGLSCWVKDNKFWRTPAFYVAEHLSSFSISYRLFAWWQKIMPILMEVVLVLCGLSTRAPSFWKRWGKSSLSNGYTTLSQTKHPRCPRGSMEKSQKSRNGNTKEQFTKKWRFNDLWKTRCVKSRAFLLRRCACFPSPSGASHRLPYPKIPPP